jgi:hypothetical protein
MAVPRERISKLAYACPALATFEAATEVPWLAVAFALDNAVLIEWASSAMRRGVPSQRWPAVAGRSGSDGNEKSAASCPAVAANEESVSPVSRALLPGMTPVDGTRSSSPLAEGSSWMDAPRRERRGRRRGADSAGAVVLVGGQDFPRDMCMLSTSRQAVTGGIEYSQLRER